MSEEKGINKGRIIDGLFFSLSDEKYAIDSRYISEVIYIKEITPLPCTPDFLLGIINIRGKIISVVDIRKFFGLAKRGITNLNRVIVVDNGDIEFGILADEIEGNNVIEIDSLQQNITKVTEVPDNFILGVSADNIIVIDIQELMTNDKIIIEEKV